MNAGIRDPDPSEVSQAAVEQAGEEHWDAGKSRLYEFAWKDIQSSEIVTPSKYAGDEGVSWARHRKLLWYLAEYSAIHEDERVARGFSGDLPVSLSHAQRLEITRNFAQMLADRKGCVVDFAVHGPHNEDGSHHAHILVSTREVTPEGFGRETFDGSRHEVLEINQMWSDHLTKAMQAAYRHERLERAQTHNAGDSLESFQRQARERWSQRKEQTKAAATATSAAQEANARQSSRNDYGL